MPVATNRVTTISFPGPIEAIDGAGVTRGRKNARPVSTRPHQRLAVSFRARPRAKASANLNIRWNNQTYVFELTESDQPVFR